MLHVSNITLSPKKYVIFYITKLQPQILFCKEYN